MKVIARTSAFAFKGQNIDIRKIAETLDVANILEGSVRRSGNRIRVTAQLITAADGSHLWSERYDRELADVFAVQDEISAAIADALHTRLSPQRNCEAALHTGASCLRSSAEGKALPLEGNSGVDGPGQALLRAGNRARPAVRISPCRVRRLS